MSLYRWCFNWQIYMSFLWLELRENYDTEKSLEDVVCKGRHRSRIWRSLDLMIMGIQVWGWLSSVWWCSFTLAILQDSQEYRTLTMKLSFQMSEMCAKILKKICSQKSFENPYTNWVGSEGLETSERRQDLLILYLPIKFHFQLLILLLAYWKYVDLAGPRPGSADMSLVPYSLTKYIDQNHLDIFLGSFSIGKS